MGLFFFRSFPERMMRTRSPDAIFCLGSLNFSATNDVSESEYLFKLTLWFPVFINSTHPLVSEFSSDKFEVDWALYSVIRTSCAVALEKLLGIQNDKIKA
jgi:hypothetical protein